MPTTEPTTQTDQHGVVIGQMPACPSWCSGRHDGDPGVFIPQRTLDVGGLRFTTEGVEFELCVGLSQWDTFENGGEIRRQPATITVNIGSTDRSVVSDLDLLHLTVEQATDPDTLRKFGAALTSAADYLSMFDELDSGDAE